MPDLSRVETVRRAFGAFAARDIETLLPMIGNEISSEVRFVMRPGWLDGPEKTYAGAVGLMQVRAALERAADDVLFEVGDVVENDDKVVIDFRQSMRPHGTLKREEYHRAQVWTFEGERATEIRIFEDVASAREAAGLT